MTRSSLDSDGKVSLRTPANRFQQGGRYVYSFTLELPTLDNLLPDLVDERVGLVENANRPLTISHAKNIQDYLEKRNNWLLGTLLLGIDPELIEFREYPGQPNGKPVIAGQLCVRNSGESAMKIFDGQHRRRAIRDTLAELRRDLRKGSKLADLQGASVPILLYSEASIDSLRQMFVDASRTLSIEKNTLAQFDRRDVFNLAAEDMAFDSRLFSGRVEIERPSIARTNPNIIAINQLAASLKTLEVGINGRISKERNDELQINVDNGLMDRCLAWSDEFMPAARQEYDDLLAGEIDNSEIPGMRDSTLAYNATVIRILAGCYHEWTKRGADWKPLAEFIRESSLKPGSGSGALLVDAGVVIPEGITPTARLSRLSAAVDYIVLAAKTLDD